MGNKSGVARKGLNVGEFATKSYVNDAIEDASTNGQSLTISSESSQYLEIVNEEISIKPLGITNVITDSTSESNFSDWYTNNFSTVDSVSGPVEISDILILTDIDSKTEIWLHNGGISDTVADFTLIQNEVTIPPTQIKLFMNSDDTVSGQESIRGLVTVDILSEEITGNLSSAYYQVSLDGEVWTDPDGVNSTISDLNTWILGNITTEIFYVRTYVIYDVSKFGEGMVSLTYT